MKILTGGCQCGHVRFRLEGSAGSASICHCRMCQKAFGNLFAPLVSTRDGQLVWTKAEPKRFRSSNHVLRGFCPECGTPLTYEAPDGVAVALGAFDDPSAIRPTRQYGIEAKMPYFQELDGLVATTTDQDLEEEPFLADLVSYQHPDAPDGDERS